MSAGARVAAFVALLVVIFAGAVGVGAALDPDVGGEHAAASAGGTHDAGHGVGHEAAPASGAHDVGHGGEHAAAARGEPAAGVSSTQDGLRLDVDRTRFAAGRPAPLRFRILDARGATIRAFDSEQARRMHLVVVRRDLRRYQHLHPTQGDDGAWTARLTLPDAGVYRAFADFRTHGTRRTLGVDLFVAGRFEPLALPPASRTAHVGGYDVLVGQRDPSVLDFSVRRRGLAIVDLQHYLGAQGHLVMLRVGDLAYRHVHPLAEPGLAFHTGPREPGTYRMFLQFRHRGRVRTAAFTRVVRP
jgi:hypothetical protein